MIFDNIKMYSYFNKSTHIVYSAGKSCYKGKLSDDYDTMLKFIKDRVKVGHESIIEHTNFFVAAIIPDRYISDLVEIISTCRYLYVDTERIYTNKKDMKKLKDYNATLINIGGSVRGWKYIYRNINNLCNSILGRITKEIYKHIPKEYFIDLIQDDILDEHKFCYINENFNYKDPYTLSSILDSNSTTENNISIPVYNKDVLDFCIPEDLENKKIKLLNIDTIEDLTLSGIPKDLIIQRGLYDRLNITVEFRNMSRIITQQLTRHRNAITQESQRYVDYTNNPVNNPMIYSDNYDDKKEYTIVSKYYRIPSTESGRVGLTSDELCKELQSIYGCLKQQGMKPEEARSFAPLNTSCGKVTVTFTYRSLAHFLKLRTDKAAQAEIRDYANILHKYIQNTDIANIFDDENNNLTNYILQPQYKINNSGIDYEVGRITEIYKDLEEDL